jgi:hypothetical protein
MPVPSAAVTVILSAPEQLEAAVAGQAHFLVLVERVERTQVMAAGMAALVCEA